MVEELHVDGNAIGGLLIELFGREMTGELGCCGHCGAVNALGAVHVYGNSPGHVIRCPVCTSVLLVVTTVSSRTRVSFGALRWLQTSD